MRDYDGATLITLDSSGSVTTQRFAHDDLVAEGYIDGGMFAPRRHPLLALRDGEPLDAWPKPRPKRSRKRK